MTPIQGVAGGGRGEREDGGENTQVDAGNRWDTGQTGPLGRREESVAACERGHFVRVGRRFPYLPFAPHRPVRLPFAGWLGCVWACAAAA